MATTIHINQIDTQSIVAVDATGAIVTPVAFDSPPVWTNSNPAAATNVVSADGLTNVLTPVAAGQTTTVAVTAIIGGVTFTATTDYSVVSGSVASISIADTFSAKPAV